MTEEQLIANEPSNVASHTESQPRKKIMTKVALAANRANDKKCTGPKTREGKFKASLNGFKHGSYSHKFIVKTEDAAAFLNFSKSFIDEFQPATPSELELLQQLISATSAPTPAAQITLKAFDSLDNEKLAFTRLLAHEFRLAALFQRTISRLQSIRDKKLRNETKFARDSPKQRRARSLTCCQIL